MANTILTSDIVARESSMVLAHELGFGASVSRRYDDKFAQSGAKIGDTFSIRIPPRYVVTDAETLVKQDSQEEKRSMSVLYSHVGLNFKHKDLLLDVNNFSKQFLSSAVAALANRIDLKGTELYKDAFNQVGKVGDGPPTSLDTYLEANARLSEENAPDGGRRVVCINALMNQKIVNALKGLHEDRAEIAMQYKKGKMKNVAGLNWLYDQNMFLHTSGTATAGAVNGAAQTGSTLILDGLGNAKTIKRGDVFNIAGVYAVDPQNRQSTTRLRDFVAQEDKTATTGGAVASLAIRPSLTATGKDQTINSVPADDAVITWKKKAAGSQGHQGMAYHPDAFALALVDDELPEDVDFKAKTKPEDAQMWNVSISIIRTYDIDSHSYPCRIGAYYSWLTQREELVTRVTS